MDQIRIGDMLLGNGFISKDDLDHALFVQEEKGGFLGRILVELGYLSPDVLSNVLDMQKKARTRDE